MSRIFPSSLALLGLLVTSLAAAPKSADPRLTVELVAREPALRTPTAIDVDGKGRIWVLENNTHFRPKDYPGPPTDRVLILDDFAPDGHAQKVGVFAEGFRDGMGLRCLPDGGAIVSTRAETFRLRDPHATGRAEERTALLKLDTKDDYPHNGLSGIALDREGHLFVSLGENHGSPWTLTGSDGSQVRGSDEGGIFRANTDGGDLQRFALGLWNPFGLTVDDHGRVFALDNDPGAGSFCRLLHIVRNGDYGYRYRYGRTVDHPFLSWFGEIPGKLPPVCLVGEAPTGILQYQGKSLPYEYAGQLLGCTWNDHGIQRFPLVEKGAAMTSKPEWLIRGGNDFRPSGIAQAPDGSLVISDWVDSSYEVHGKGRVWRVRANDPAAAASPIPRSPAFDSAGEQKPNASFETKLALLQEQDAFSFHDAIESLVRDPAFEKLASHADDPDPRVRLGVLLAYRRSHSPAGIDMLPKWLGDPDGTVRRAALQWASEEHLTALQPAFDAALVAPLSRATLGAYLAAIQMMVSGHPDPKATISQTRQIALDSARPGELRALALRLLPTEESALPYAGLEKLLAEKEAPVRKEALHILATRQDEKSQVALRKIAADPRENAEFRADALAGLAATAGNPETAAVLQSGLEGGDNPLKAEALRALRGHLSVSAFEAALKNAEGTDEASRDLREQLLFQTRSNPALQTFAADPKLAAATSARPVPDQPWPAIATGKGDPAAGRRIFYHPNGPRCYTCHSVEGRGGNVGPDLTHIGKLTSDELLVAIRQPSKDVAPAFTQWLLKLKDGTEASGIDAFEDNKSSVFLIDASGKRTKYDVANIVSREPLPISLMPPGLDYSMTEQELRDLIAFLRETRE